MGERGMEKMKSLKWDDGGGMEWQGGGKGGKEWRNECRTGWVWKGLGGLASDASIIDHLAESKHAH